ncbi:MAG: RagB/SusD family nutrient uptake outer membrane protein [Candidatus Cryptobacteroides sp.]
MKKLTYSILIASAAMWATSCNFLDEELKGGYTSESFYKDAKNAEMAVNGVYNSLYDHKLWIFTDVASDDAVKGGNAGDQADINSIDNFSATADNGPINEFWQHTYETITRANNVITNVQKMNINEQTKASYVAQSKFFRAYSYFNLVNIFGQVPLKLLPQDNHDAIHVGLSGIDKIYEQIDKDLADAVTVLPEEYTPSEAGRVTRGAALALLAKSKLYQKDYNACLGAISQIEQLDIYDLEQNFSDLFMRGGEDSVESMFAIRYANNTTAQLGNNLNVWFAPSPEGGYYFNAPTEDFVRTFDESTVNGETDPRLDASIGREGQPWFGTTFSSSWSEATGYLVKKYHEALPEGEAISQSTIPQHILRYADVLLMKAEALNESSQAGAEIPLNRVRSRANLAQVSGLSQDQMRVLIRKERRRELSFEFQRFFDLMRYGKEYATTALPDLPWNAERYYFPLPQSETDINTSIK